MASHSSKAFQNDDYHNAYWATASHALAHVSEDGLFLDVNESFSKLVGYTRAELLLKRFQDITDTVELHNDVDSADAVIKGDIRSYGIDKGYRHKNGSLVMINLQVRRVPYSRGLPFEHFVVHAYKKPPLANIKHIVDQNGEAKMRTTTSWRDLVSDNKSAMIFFISFIATLGFVSGNFEGIIDLIKSIWGKK